MSGQAGKELAAGKGAGVMDGLTATGRAMGRAIGFFRRIGGTKSNIKQVRQVQRPATQQRPQKSTDRRRDDQQLEREIQRLEGELDQVYASMVQGVGSAHVGADLGLDAPRDMVGRARALQETLRDKRRSLARQQRRVQRERQLQARERGRVANRAAQRETNPNAKQAPAAAGAPGSRAALEKAIRQLGPAEASQRMTLEQLGRSLLSEDPNVRRKAAERLGELAVPESSRLLVAAVDDPNERVRITVLNALVRLGDRGTVGVFRHFVSSANFHVRLAALRGLSKLGATDADTHLLDALDDPHAAVRKTAATLLGWRETREAVRPLIYTLRDPEPDVRAAAASALAGIRHERAVLALIRALGDDVPAVREAALFAIRTIVGAEVDASTSLDGAAAEQQIAALKTWWQTARVDRQVAHVSGLPPVSIPTAPAPPPAEKSTTAKSKGQPTPKPTASTAAEVAATPRPPQAKTTADKPAATKPAATKPAAAAKPAAAPASSVASAPSANATSDSAAKTTVLPAEIDSLGLDVGLDDDAEGGGEADFDLLGDIGNEEDPANKDGSDSDGEFESLLDD